MEEDINSREVFELLIPVPEASASERMEGHTVLFSAPGETGKGDSPPARSMPDMLGLWTTVPLLPAEGIAFGTAAAGTAEAPVWRANLSPDPDLAAAQIASAEASLDASQAALTTATDRINALVEEQKEQPAGLAFAVSAVGPALAQPERELLALLEEAEKGRPPVSFGAAEVISGGWAQATQQFQGFVDQLRRIVSHYAWVETRVQGKLLSQTTVGWTGDMDTAWQGGLDPAQMALHQRTLALALASRAMLIRTFVVATSGAAKLSVLLSTPGGVILALPAAWKFINQVRTELEKHQQITKEI